MAETTELRRLLAAVREAVLLAEERLDRGNFSFRLVHEDLAAAAEDLGRAVDLAAAPHPPAAAQLSLAIPPAHARARVLLVDDEALAVDCITEYLDGRGYDVLPAGSPRDALALAARRIVDVVVTDLRMAGMDGTQLVAELRRARPGLPAVVVTGHLADRIETGSGPTLVMAKPLALDRLEAAICDLLAHRGREAL